MPAAEPPRRSNTPPPHVRLAGVRLAGLARRVRMALAARPRASGLADWDIALLAADTQTRAGAALEALVPAINLLAAEVFDPGRRARVAEVDEALARIAACIDHMLAMRADLMLRRFAPEAERLRQPAIDTLTRPLLQLAELFEAMHLAIDDPERFFTRYPDGEIRLALDLDIGAAIRALAA